MTSTAGSRPDGAEAAPASPAERYARAAARGRADAGPLGTFRRQYPFELDEFQLRACSALADGRGVLVAAPTGSGKTVVGEFAVHLALQTRRKTFYTTPIKALSNQKYADLVRRYGPEAVGLLTGDNTVNSEAPVVVMTTEVLRNMLYADSPTLAGLGYVVMDEVHYLADRFRGAVWEEVIIHLPDDVLVVSLSATVSNAEEFGDWLDTVRGDTEVVVSEHRPVPLWQHVMVGQQAVRPVRRRGAADRPGRNAAAGRVRVNPGVDAVARDEGRAVRTGPGEGAATAAGAARPGRAEPGRRDLAAGPGRPPAVDHLHLQPGGLRRRRPAVPLLGRAAHVRGRARRDPPVVDARCADIPDEDLTVLGYWEWAEGLERGLAAHHAGLLPTFKEVVEELFSRGLVKAVFATETLALGVNMPGTQRRAREAREVERRDPRRRDAPASTPSSPGVRAVAGSTSRVTPSCCGSRASTRRPSPGLASTRYLPAAVELPPDVQHGRQPGRPGRPGARPGDPRDVLRAVPGRPGRGRPGPAGPPAGGGARRLRGGDEVPPRRLHRVRSPAAARLGPRVRAVTPL
jgi:ATP-dependent RNA helicase HelY